jgi:hypothetical protein
MIWFAWRTQRLQILVSIVGVALLIGWLLLTGRHEEVAYTALSHGHCFGSERNFNTPVCNHLQTRYDDSDRWTRDNFGALYILPGGLGLLFGVPMLAREFEHGTNRLAWTQGITRTRWLAVKLVMGLAVIALLMAIMLPVVDWWTHAVQSAPRIFPRTFDVVGIVPFAYSLLAYGTGTALGALIRRTAWGLALGVVLFVGARVLLRQMRSRLAPLSYHAGLGSGPKSLQTGWEVNQGYVPIGSVTPGAGKNWNSGTNTFFNCLNKFSGGKPPTQAQDNFLQVACQKVHHLHYVTAYQPASHFWALQTAESGIVGGTALVLLGVAVLAVRRWRT